MRTLFNIDSYKSNPFKEYGCNEFIGKPMNYNIIGFGGLGYNTYGYNSIKGGALNKEQHKLLSDNLEYINDLEKQRVELMNNYNENSDMIETISNEIKDLYDINKDLEDRLQGTEEELTYEELENIPDIDNILLEYVKDEPMPTLTQGRRSEDLQINIDRYNELYEECKKFYNERMKESPTNSELIEFENNILEIKKLLKENPSILKIVKKEIEEPQLTKSELIDNLSHVTKHGKLKYNIDEMNNMTIEELKKLKSESKLTKKNIHTPEFIDIMEERHKEEAELFGKETPIIDKENIHSLLKGRFEEIETYYDTIKNDINSVNKFDDKYNDSSDYELSYIPNTYYTLGKNSEGEGELKYNDGVNPLDLQIPIQDCEHLLSLLYAIDRDLYDKLISYGGKVKEYYNTDLNVYTNDKKQIWKKNKYDVYDNIVVLEYIEKGITREEKIVIENKCWGSEKGTYANDTDSYFGKISDLNQKSDLITLVDIDAELSKIEKKLSDIETEKSTIETENSKIDKLLIDAELEDDINETKRLKKIKKELQNQQEELQNQQVSKQKELQDQELLQKTGFKQGLHMSQGKFGHTVPKGEFIPNPKFKASEAEQRKLQSSYSSNRNPKFDKNGRIKHIVDKSGNRLPDNDPSNKKYIGARVLFNMKYQDCELGVNYSDLIKTKTVNPSSILEKFRLGKSRYGGTSKEFKETAVFNSILIDTVYAKVLLKPPKNPPKDESPKKVKRNKGTGVKKII